MAPQRCGCRALSAALLCVVLAVSGTAQPLEVVSLSPSRFEHATQAATGQTTGAWAVLLLNSSDAGAVRAAEVALDAWDSLAADPDKDCIMSQVDVAAPGGAALARRFSVTAVPAVLLLRDRRMWRWTALPATGDAPELADAARAWLAGGFAAVPGSSVPPEPGALDFVREVAGMLKVEPSAMLYVGIACIGVGVLIFIAFLGVGLWALVPDRPRPKPRAAVVGGTVDSPAADGAGPEGGDESEQQQGTGAARGATRATTRRRA